MDENEARQNYVDERTASWKYGDGIGFGGESELRRRHYHSNNAAKKRRKQREQDYSDEEEKEEDDEYFNADREDKEEILPKWKIFAVGAAIFLCFAILYPSVFGPFVGSLFGGNKAGGGDQSTQQRNVHPSMMGAHPNQRDARPGRPHPAAPQMPPQQGQGGGGGGRGGFAWLLPFYTIGVVCFLLYTLFKIMFKSKKKKKQKRKGGQQKLWDEEDDEDSDEDGIQGARGQKLHSVQTRLRKTEHAMHEILQQLELIANQSEQFRQKAQPKEGDDGQREMHSTGDQQNQSNTTDEEKEKQGSGGGGLTGEQTTQMEMRLKELKMLSEMVKRDQLLRRRLREHSSTEVSDEEEEELEEEDGKENNEEMDSQTDEESELEEEAEERRKSD